MTLLAISLLGAPEFRLGGAPITTIESDKTRALLAYLAVQADRPHRRETLAALLWPDVPDRQARHNLRQALHNLRAALGDHTSSTPHLVADRHEVQFRLCHTCWLDVTQFWSLVQTLAKPGDDAERLQRWRQAVQLYRGEFLQGFTLVGAEAFEEWRMFKQEELHCELMDVLAQLCAGYERRGELGEARRFLLRQLEHEPWREEVHRKLMQLYWHDGQHGAALHQYDKCRHILHHELAVPPDPETTALYERILAQPHAWRECNFVASSRQSP